jgi:hypothetical protein
MFSLCVLLHNMMYVGTVKRSLSPWRKNVDWMYLRVLQRRIFEPIRKEVTGGKRCCIMRKLIIRVLHWIEKYVIKLKRLRWVQGGDEKCIQTFKWKNWRESLWKYMYMLKDNMDSDGYGNQPSNWIKMGNFSAARATIKLCPMVLIGFLCLI